MSAVAVVEYTCPVCKEKYVHFYQALENAAFAVTDMYCAQCVDVVKMASNIKRKVTTDQLSLARKRATENLNESIATQLDGV